MRHDGVAGVLCVAAVALVCSCGGSGAAELPATPASTLASHSEPEIPNEIYVSPTGADGNSGSEAQPLRSIEAGVARLKPGLVLVLLDGKWKLTAPIVVSVQGKADAWVEIRGAKGTKPILDASAVDISSPSAYPGVRGAVQIENAAYVRIRNVHVTGSHAAGFNVAVSHDVDILNCSSRGSFASGISAWQGTEHVRVLGNEVHGANDKALSFAPFTGDEAPHEAISIAGTRTFEVAWNEVSDNRKEGIDVKETSTGGVVHHNHCWNNDRQGLYVDGWFGVLEDVEFSDNVVHDNEAGIAVSSEDGPTTRNVRIRRNVVFSNRAAGLYFSRWGKNNPREDVVVANNTFYRNGYGRSAAGDSSYWLMGGLYLHSTNLRNVTVRDNIFAEDYPFEIGYSGDWGRSGPGGVSIVHNFIDDTNTAASPFHMTTWAKDDVFSTKGDNAILGTPLFVDTAAQDFRLRPGSPAAGMGAFEAGAPLDPWWRHSFPPEITP